MDGMAVSYLRAMNDVQLLYRRDMIVFRSDWEKQFIRKYVFQFITSRLLS